MTSRTPTAPTGPAFQGSPEQADLAAHVFELMRRQGMLFAADAPITVALDRLVQGLGRAYPGVAAAKLSAQVEEALAANPDIFVRQEQGGAISFVTSKAGRVPVSLAQ